MELLYQLLNSLILLLSTISLDVIYTQAMKIVIEYIWETVFKPTFNKIHTERFISKELSCEKEIITKAYSNFKYGNASHHLVTIHSIDNSNQIRSCSEAIIKSGHLHRSKTLVCAKGVLDCLDKHKALTAIYTKERTRQSLHDIFNNLLLYFFLLRLFQHFSCHRSKLLEQYYDSQPKSPSDPENMIYNLQTGYFSHYFNNDVNSITEDGTPLLRLIIHARKQV